MTGYILVGLILYVVIGVFYTIIQTDWMDQNSVLPKSHIRIASLIIAIMLLWPAFLVVTAVYIVKDGL